MFCQTIFPRLAKWTLLFIMHLERKGTFQSMISWMAVPRMRERLNMWSLSSLMDSGSQPRPPCPSSGQSRACLKGNKRYLQRDDHETWQENNNLVKIVAMICTGRELYIIPKKLSCLFVSMCLASLLNLRFEVLLRGFSFFRARLFIFP